MSWPTCGTVLLGIVLGCVGFGPVAAQEAATSVAPSATSTQQTVLPVLVFDRSRILSDSKLGQAFEAEIQQTRDALGSRKQ